MRVLGIYRLPLFSNNAIEADRMILEEAMKALQVRSSLPLEIDFIEEPEIEKINAPYDLVLTMAQSQEALARLADKKNLIPHIWNSIDAVRNCYRATMSKKLENAGVGYAAFKLISTQEDITPYIEAGASYWMKRGDFHAISDDDVSLAENLEEARKKMERFREKNIPTIVLQKHITGDIYKFYGVNGDFFTTIRVRKFLDGEREINRSELKDKSSRAAKLLGLQIYGGDAILDEAGNLHLIDLNDWPSFRICRAEAAASIGVYTANFLQSLATAKKALANSNSKGN